jgi:hypothetical protein
MAKIGLVEGSTGRAATSRRASGAVKVWTPCYFQSTTRTPAGTRASCRSATTSTKGRMSRAATHQRTDIGSTGRAATSRAAQSGPSVSDELRVWRDAKRCGCLSVPPAGTPASCRSATTSTQGRMSALRLIRAAQSGPSVSDELRVWRDAKRCGCSSIPPAGTRASCRSATTSTKVG